MTCLDLHTSDIFCIACDKEVEALLQSGDMIYPHRPDLKYIPFWKCPTCKGYVGCHHKGDKPSTKPLGCIPTPEITKARREIHKLLDPLWKRGLYKRKKVYSMISEFIGKEYHTGEIRTMDEVLLVKIYLKSLRRKEGRNE